MISPQLVEHNRAVKEEKSLEAVVLSDPGNQVAERFGIRYAFPDELIAVYRQFNLDIPKHNGDDSWALPIPTRLIIDTEGVIRYADINADYTQRPEPEETLEALEKIV